MSSHRNISTALLGANLKRRSKCLTPQSNTVKHSKALHLLS